jgi:2,3-dihydroxy-2,3-dihydro-p-cumate dehydrogenase
MVDAGYGRIVHIGAESVRNGLYRHAIYNAAKGGVHALGTGLAREFADSGITVNMVAPAWIETPEAAAKFAAAPAEVREDMAVFGTQMRNLIPMDRPGTVEEVAATVAFVASEEASYVTGQVISVNGGSSML